MSPKTSYAFVVPGRFWAFDLARELIHGGHRTRIFTNYPSGVVTRWGVDRASTEGNVIHGIASRVRDKIVPNRGQSVLDPMFGRWARRRLSRQPTFDVT